MNYSEIKRFTDYLDYLLRCGNAGTAAEIADRLGTCERTVRSYFEQLKSMGVPLEYDCVRRTWRYTRSGRLTLGFVDEDCGAACNADASTSPPKKYVVEHKKKLQAGKVAADLAAYFAVTNPLK